jgi:hypothetical protein
VRQPIRSATTSRTLLKRLLTGLLIFLSTILQTNPLYAQSPGENFWSDALLDLAVAEVRRLDRDQLETFIEYLATCEASVDSKDREFACERAKLRLEIKAHTARALQKLVFAMAVSSRIVKLGWDRADREEKDRLAKSITRGVDIAGRLRTAASERYTQLGPAVKPP